MVSALVVLTFARRCHSQPLDEGGRQQRLWDGRAL